MTNADHFHIPPRDGCAQCGELAKEHHYNGACYGKCGEYVDPRSPLGIAKVALSKTAPSVDLAPIVAWWRDELSAARTAAADAKCHAAGHRERVVELEVRLKAALEERDSNTAAFAAQQELLVSLTRKLEELQSAQATLTRIEHAWCIEGDYAGDPDNPDADKRHPIERRLASMTAMHTRDLDRMRMHLEHARCDAKDAQQILMDERKRVQVPREELLPGSVNAIKAAVRLVCGHEPSVEPNGLAPYWSARSCKTVTADMARMALLDLLETLQPAATVKS